MSEHQNLGEFDAHVAKRYQMDKRLGRGAYGIVWKAKTRKSNRVVAVKKIFDAFRNKTDAQRTFREIIFLKAFRDHPNVVRLLNVHRADNNRDLYLVFEYMNTDLQRAIHRRPGMLKDIHRRFIMYQLLSATRYLHAGNVIHRDQKPSNVLLDTDCLVKIADFGLARSLSHMPKPTDSSQEPCLTDYVATRWYRAPEILLGCKRYTTGVDLWSLGCILGEMLSRRPLFPGNSTLEQIEMIFSSQLLQKDTDTLLKFKSHCIRSDYALSLVDKAIAANKKPSHHKDPGPNFIESDSNDTIEALDLTKKLLKVNPDDRITAEDALKHAYVVKFFNHSVEDKCRTRVVHPPLDEDTQFTIEEYREKLYEIIQEQKVR